MHPAGTCHLFLQGLKVRENSRAALVCSLPPRAQHMVSTIKAGWMNEFSLSSEDLGDATPNSLEVMKYRMEKFARLGGPRVLGMRLSLFTSSTPI